MIKAAFLMPDYYDSFACKGLACKSTCCQGWKVCVSFEEYTRLIGVDCSRELRKRLDCAFYLNETPSPQSYAYLKHNWQGDCPLRDGDGLCALQKELGENILPSICRYYPRNFIPKYQYECSCANSCEKVVEILTERKEKIGFVLSEKQFDAYGAPLNPKGGISQYYISIRQKCIDILQNRAKNFDDRMLVLGIFISKLKAAANEEMSKIINGFDINADTEFKDIKLNRKRALRVQTELAEVFEKFSPVIADCNSEVRANLGFADGKPNSETLCKLFKSGLEHFKIIVPDDEIVLENLMVNHLFYCKLPFSCDNLDVWEDYVSFCAAYIFLKYFVVGFMIDEINIEAFTDVVAKVFRFIEHSNFDLNTDIIFNREHIADIDSLKSLLKSIY